MGMKVNGSTGLTFPDSTTMVTGSQAVKAWVNFNGTGTVAIRASYNVTSITDNGTGDYTVNFTTALQDANYAVTFGVGNGTSGTAAMALYNGGVYSTTALRLSTYRTETGSSVDMAICNVSVFR